MSALSDWWDAGPKPHAIDREDTGATPDIGRMDNWKTPGFDGRATVEHAKAVTRMSGEEYERLASPDRIIDPPFERITAAELELRTHSLIHEINNIKDQYPDTVTGEMGLQVDIPGNREIREAAIAEITDSPVYQAVYGAGGPCCQYGDMEVTRVNGAEYKPTPGLERNEPEIER